MSCSCYLDSHAILLPQTVAGWSTYSVMAAQETICTKMEYNLFNVVTVEQFVFTSYHSYEGITGTHDFISHHWYFIGGAFP